MLYAKIILLFLICKYFLENFFMLILLKINKLQRFVELTEDIADKGFKLNPLSSIPAGSGSLSMHHLCSAAAHNNKGFKLNPLLIQTAKSTLH
jgi:hypothetical protein